MAPVPSRLLWRAQPAHQRRAGGCRARRVAALHPVSPGQGLFSIHRHSSKSRFVPVIQLCRDGWPRGRTALVRSPPVGRDRYLIGVSPGSEEAAAAVAAHHWATSAGVRPPGHRGCAKLLSAEGGKPLPRLLETWPEGRKAQPVSCQPDTPFAHTFPLPRCVFSGRASVPRKPLQGCGRPPRDGGLTGL